MSCRACRSSVSSPSRRDASCLALSSRLNEGFFCKVSSNCLSAAFSCAGRRTCRALYSSTESKSAACAFSSAYSSKALSNSAEYFCSCASSFFRPASMVAISLRNASAPASSAYSNFCKRRDFSERSSSKSSVSSAIRTASALWRITWYIGNAFFSATSVLRSLLFSLICCTRPV